MTLEETRSIQQTIALSRWSELADELTAAAVRYARLRVDWQLADGDARRAMDEERTRAHDAFIDSCGILARSMETAGEDASWHRRIGNDRKTIGDFACWLHCLLGLQAR
jgi:hypothetical protein